MATKTIVSQPETTETRPTPTEWALIEAEQAGRYAAEIDEAWAAWTELTYCDPAEMEL